MQRPYRNNRQHPQYQWVPKSTIAARSLPSFSDAEPTAQLPHPATGAPPRPGNGRSKRRQRRPRSRRKGKPHGVDANERRNWAEMPSDALSVIFEKLGPFRVLILAQAVCRSWRQLANEPGTWRKVDFRDDVWDFYDPSCDLVKMGLTAVDRSNGLLEEFSIEHFVNDQIITYMAERSPELKCLRLVTCYDVTNEGLKEAIKKLPLLEEISITFHSLSTEEVLPTIGESCPLLKRFHLNVQGCRYYELVGHEDTEALKIAKTMPMLRELQLFGNLMTNEGLREIIDGCPHLESLDMRQCFNVKMDEALKKRCANIKHLRLPNDSTADSPYISDFADMREEFGPFGDYDDDDGSYDYGMHAYDDYFEDFSGLGYGNFYFEYPYGSGESESADLNFRVYGSDD